MNVSKIEKIFLFLQKSILLSLCKVILLLYNVNMDGRIFLFLYK